MRYQCLKCGTASTHDTDDVQVTACPTCGPTELWKTFGKLWVYAHTTDFWEMLETTNDVRVPSKFRDWIVGQELPIKKTRLEMRRWIEKVKDIQKLLKQGIDPSGMLKERPGPYVLFISEPGTGKSLLIKILAEEMEELYLREGIELSDVMCLENKMDRYRPIIREVPAGLGQRIIAQSERGALNEQREKQRVLFTILAVVMGFGGMMVGTALFIMGVFAMQVGIVATWFSYSGAFIGWLIPGMLLLVFPMMIFMFRSGSMLGVNQKDLLNVPHLLVDNGPGRKLVINMTVTNPETMFGDIKWNAFGDTPGMTPPLHTRVVAGDVHKAHFKLGFIDEIRNTSIPLAIEFLTVMEDGETVIKAHPTATGGSHGSSILSIATADPVPANFMLIAAGNMDVLYNPASILNQVPAFRDRFNYGDIIYLETHMDATPQNEVKIVQVVTDEIYRFGLRPMEKAGLRRIVEYMRSRADNNKKFKVMWRYVIKVAIKAYELALLEEHPTITLEHVNEAIDIYCKPVEAQAMDEYLENRKDFRIVPPVDKPEFGVVKALAVVGDPKEGRSAGVMNPVAAHVYLLDDPKLAPGEIILTGTTKDQESWVQDSIQHVRTAIKKLYGIDLAKQTYAAVSFAQSKGTEGPSAGVSMTLAIMSCLGDPRLPAVHPGSDKCTEHKAHRKPVPIRQDVAVTGTIELLPDPLNPFNVRVGFIGGVADKIQGAHNAGCRYVIIPKENFEHTLTQEKYPVQVLGADTILGYFDLIRGDTNVIDALLKGKTPATDEEIRLWTEKQARSKLARMEAV